MCVRRSRHIPFSLPACQDNSGWIFYVATTCKSINTEPHDNRLSLLSMRLWNQSTASPAKWSFLHSCHFECRNLSTLLIHSQFPYIKATLLKAGICCKCSLTLISACLEARSLLGDEGIGWDLMCILNTYCMSENVSLYWTIILTMSPLKLPPTNSKVKETERSKEILISD